MDMGSKVFKGMGIVLLCSMMCVRADFSFIADSDMQLHEPKQAEQKTGHVPAIISLIQDRDRAVKALLIPGDLVDGIPSAVNASSYVSKAGLFVQEKLKEKKKDARSTIQKQFEDFLTTWYNPIRAAFKQRWGRSGAYIYATAGNHEYYDYYIQNVTNWLHKQYGGLYYSFTVENVHFCCLGVVPNRSMYHWLENDLREHKDMSTILFFHYNVRGDTSRWWSRDQIMAFWECIKPFKDRIKLIVHGHNHFSYTTEWNKVPVICVGGKEFACVDCDQNTGRITATFYDAEQNKPKPVAAQVIDHTKWPDDTKKDDDNKRIERQWNWNLTHRVPLPKAIKELGGHIVQVSVERVHTGFTRIKKGVDGISIKVKKWLKKKK